MSARTPPDGPQHGPQPGWMAPFRPLAGPEKVRGGVFDFGVSQILAQKVRGGLLLRGGVIIRLPVVFPMDFLPPPHHETVILF